MALSADELRDHRHAQLDLSGASYAGEDLTDLELRRCSLRGVDLSGAILEGAELEACDLTEADLRGAALEGARLIGCDLSGAKIDVAALDAVVLEGCEGVPDLPQDTLEVWGVQVPLATWLAVTQGRTRGVVLEGATLRGPIEDADFAGARLSGLTLRRAEVARVDLSGADLSGAKLKDTVFEDCDFTGANLDGADLRGVSFEGCALRRVSLRGIRADRQTTFERLEEIDWSGEDLRRVVHEDWMDGGKDLDLTGAKLQKTHMYGTFEGLNLAGADCRGASFFDMELSRASFAGANLAGGELMGCASDPVDLRGANLTDAVLNVDFPGADLTGACLRGVRGEPSDPTSLVGATLDGADLTSAVLAGFDLSGASLRGAVLRGAELLETALEGADLTDADVEGAVVDDEGMALLTAAPVRGTPTLYAPPAPPPREPRVEVRHVDAELAKLAETPALTAARSAAARWESGDLGLACAALSAVGVHATPAHLTQLGALLDTLQARDRDPSWSLDRAAVAVCMVQARHGGTGTFWVRGGLTTSRARYNTLCVGVFHAQRGLVAVGLGKGRRPSRWKLLSPWTASPRKNLERALRWVRKGAKDRVLIPCDVD